MPMGKIYRAPVPRRKMYGKKLNKKQKKQVKTLISRRQDLKFSDYVSAFQAISNAAVTTGIAIIPQNNTVNGRVGDRVQWVGNIDFRLNIINAQGIGADPYNNVRVILFQWHPASSPTAPDILAPGPFGSFDFMSHYNFDNRQEYKILFDKTFRTTLPTPSDLPVEQQLTRHFKISTKKMAHYSQFTPAGGLFATNRVFLTLLSDSALANHPLVSVDIRSFWRDS